MPSLNIPKMQQFVPADMARRRAAGCWELAADRAMSLRPRERSVLEIAQGRVWLTLEGGLHLPPELAGDHMLHAGERFIVEAGQHVVIEAWGSPGVPGEVHFRWDAMPEAFAARNIVLSACAEWECAVAQPLRDLAHALGRAGTAIGVALGEIKGAGGRLATGLARFAIHRVAEPWARRPA